jgi:uncharacterized membrane protein YeaQ/YmgE (transglycosylase-associated protein family)
MDQPTLHRNADRVARIFNALSIFVLVIGLLGAIAVLLSGFVGAFLGSSLSRYSDYSDGSAGLAIASIVSGIIGALAVVIYTLITWAGVQLAALVAGYIKVRTAIAPPAGPMPPYSPS